MCAFYVGGGYIECKGLSLRQTFFRHAHFSNVRPNVCADRWPVGPLQPVSPRTHRAGKTGVGRRVRFASRRLEPAARRL